MFEYLFNDDGIRCPRAIGARMKRPLFVVQLLTSIIPITIQLQLRLKILLQSGINTYCLLHSLPCIL